MIKLKNEDGLDVYFYPDDVKSIEGHYETKDGETKIVSTINLHSWHTLYHIDASPADVLLAMKYDNE